jgi:hypothetical protein
MKRCLMITALMALATPAAAAPWTHPDAGFALDVPAGWEEKVSSRTPTVAVFTPSPSFLATIVCTVVTAPLAGPPATPAGWRMPDQILANPNDILTRNGDRVLTVMGSRKFKGADGYGGWQLWADVVKPGAVAPYFKQISHVLTGPNTQVTTACITPSNIRGSLTTKTIEESLALGASMRAAR